MSILQQKLKDASKLYQSHQFKKSIEAYDECLKFAYKTQQCQSIIHNILSTKASLEYILGQYDKALATIQLVLKQDPYHFLCLLRRSQIYKKTNKLKRSLKDLQRIYVFCPDNLQVSALKVQIQHLIIKQNKNIQTSSSEQQQDNQEQCINFMRLKSIDRKSSQVSKIKSRSSRVTILGDMTFQYKIQENNDNKKQQIEDIHDKAVRTYKQIILDDQQNQNEEQIPIINIKTPKSRGKSILKNKATSIFINQQQKSQKISKYLGRQSKLLSMLKNIDGKVIPSSQTINSSHNNIKEVQFRKSVSQPFNLLQLNLQKQSMKSSISNGSQKRKSCLKRPSFQGIEQKTTNIRRSRFQNMNSLKIDGHVITKYAPRKSIEGNYYVDNDEINQQKKQNIDSDNEDSSHNIFGSKNYVLTSDMKLKLGIHQDMIELTDAPPKLKNKKSILKKNSSVGISSSSPKNGKQLSPFSLFATQSRQNNENGKSGGKKSVMFSCTM